MIPWLGFERRWRDALLNAMVPVLEGSRRPPIALDEGDFWRRFRRAAPPLLHIGLRVAVWVLSLGPLVFIGRFRTFRGLSPADRDRLLVKVDGHRRFLVRQLALVVKTVACWAVLAEPRARREVGGREIDALDGLEGRDG